MSNPVVGLWLNDVPYDILNNEDSLQELSELISKRYRAQKMVIADNALLFTMEKENSLPQNYIGNVAQGFKSFLLKKKVPKAKMAAITLSFYDDSNEWESIKDEIIASTAQKALKWDQKPLEVWTFEDILQWLRDKGLDQYIQYFKENHIDGENLLELNEGDLKDLGISSIGNRKVFMRHLIEARNLTYDSEQELPAFSDDSFQETKAKSDILRDESIKKPPLNCVIVRGLPRHLLQDDDMLFDIENLVFSYYSVESFEPRFDDILVKFGSPIKTTEVMKLKEKFTGVLKSLMLDSQVEGSIMIDLCDESGKIPVSENISHIEKVVEEREGEDISPTMINYWKDFWEKLSTNGDVEDFFSDEESRLNIRGARRVLATIRDVKLRDVMNDDPGIRHLLGLYPLEIQANFSNCPMQVMNEVEGTKPKEVKKLYIGVSVEGLPRFITDSDNTVHGIQSLVFRDVGVRRFIVLDDQIRPSLKVEFAKCIIPDKIPQLARNLKSFLKAVNVDQETLDDVTIAFLELDGKTEWPSISSNHHAIQRPHEDPGHKRLQTDEFLVTPGDAVELVSTFMIEGIPANYFNEDKFLQDMPENVFEGLPLEGIPVPSATNQADSSITQTSLAIRFKDPQNIQKLPKIAIKLKKFLKGKQIPPHIVNRVTLQVRHDEVSSSALNANPVIGLVFKGIPKNILEKTKSLNDLEDEVFKVSHPIRMMESNEANLMLRMTLKNPVYNQEDLAIIAHRLKRFLAKQGVGQQTINDVLVMSFNKETWQQDWPKETPPVFNSNYVGIQLENMPTSIVDSDENLQEIQRRVFFKQEVVHINVIDTTLRVTFGLASNSKDIQNVARELKQFLSKKKIPIKQINDIIITPHTEDTWESQ